jgi:hypothetical protein
MAVLASDIMTSAGIMLNDVDHVRWTPSELGRWINDGVKAIIIAKPSASAKSIELSLVEGTLQKVPVAASPYPFQLIDITCNLIGVSPRVGGRKVTVTTKDQLDAQSPYWHSPKDVKFQKEARHFVIDDRNPLEFYVYPGNNGTGLVEAIVSFYTPVVATGDQSLVASWGVDCGIAEPYSEPLLEYVLSKCQMKDDTGANAGRAVAHYQKFAATLGIKIQTEKASSANARPS